MAPGLPRCRKPDGKTDTLDAEYAARSRHRADRSMAGGLW